MPKNSGKDSLDFAVNTIKRIKEKGSICFIYNITDEMKKNLVDREEFGAVKIALIYKNTRYHVITTLSSLFNVDIKENVSKKLLKIYEEARHQKLLLIFDNAEMATTGILKLAQDFNDAGIGLVFISSHPRYEHLMRDKNIYKNKMVMEIDFNMNLK